MHFKRVDDYTAQKSWEQVLQKENKCFSCMPQVTYLSLLLEYNNVHNSLLILLDTNKLCAVYFTHETN